ncbi:Retinol dehydrogenase 12, partial [Borealophlyctis nickersoniae]
GNPRSTYNKSKLANILFTFALARRLAGTGVITHALHPGVVRTGFAKNLPSNMYTVYCLTLPFTYPMLKSPWEGAQTTLHVALSDEAGRVGGGYWSDCAVAPVESDQARNLEVQEAFWEASRKIVGI